MIRLTNVQFPEITAIIFVFGMLHTETNRPLIFCTNKLE
jgi:hypothetical protein